VAKNPTVYHMDVVQIPTSAQNKLVIKQKSKSIDPLCPATASECLRYLALISAFLTIVQATEYAFRNQTRAKLHKIVIFVLAQSKHIQIHKETLLKTIKDRLNG
jgi:hypothetical protein